MLTAQPGVRTDTILKRQGARCESCPLRKAPYVPSWVPDDPQFIIVGEAPGADEVLRGRPFVGRAGQLLQSRLAAVGLDFERAAVLNVASCRPPNNQLPSEAAKCCLPGLANELRQIRESASRRLYVLALGQTATNALNPSSASFTMTALRGRWIKGVCLPTWHPAYVLRAPSKDTEFRADLEKFARVVRGEAEPGGSTPPLPSALIAKSIEEAREFLEVRSGGVWAFDLETDQIDWQRDRILCMCVATSTDECIVIPDSLLYTPECTDLLVAQFSRADVKWVGHNAKFDMHFLAHQIGVHNVRVDYDTLIAHYALDENSPHALKTLLFEYFGYEDYEKALVQRFLKSRNDRYGKVPRKYLYTYVALDATLTLRLWFELERQLRAEGLFERPFVWPLMASQSVLLQMELRGISVSREAITRLERALRLEADRRLHRLFEIAGTEFNPNAPQQVSYVLYDVLGCPDPPKVRGVKPRSTSKVARAALDRIRSALPDRVREWLQLYAEYKSLDKLRSSYVDNLLQLVFKEGGDGRAHPDFLVYGSETGRLSARDPAIQTIPRPGTAEVGGVAWGKYIRSVFTSDGGVLVAADYSQAELRVAAALSGDEFLIEAYRHDRDLHSEVATAMFGPGFTKEQRMLCKMFNFSYLYGGTEYSFAESANLPIDTARAFVRRYNQVMKTLAAWRERQFKIMRERGYVETRVGRRRRFPLITEVNIEDARKASVNMPVQSLASDITLAALIEFDSRLKERGWWSWARPIITVHDSIIVDVTDRERWQDVARLLRDTMIESAVSLVPEVPWKVDVSVGPDWGHLEEVEL
jgi:DNA polymerase-1